MKEEHRLMVAVLENQIACLQDKLRAYPHTAEERLWKENEIRSHESIRNDIKSLYSRRNSYGTNLNVTRVRIRSAWDAMRRAEFYHCPKKKA